jgi:hypothetical protein
MITITATIDHRFLDGAQARCDGAAAAREARR